MAIVVKDPDDKLDYTLDFSDVFGSSESIDTASWTVPAGISQVSQSESGLEATIVLDGGTAGDTYELEVLVTTTPSGLEAQGELVVYMEDPLTVEDGTIVTGANSYVSLLDAEKYLAKRGIPSEWQSASVQSKKAAILYATDFIENRFSFYGNLEDKTQPLSFPRTAFNDVEGRELAGEAVIPQAIKDAVVEMAVNHLKEALNEPVEEGTNVMIERIGSAYTQFKNGRPTRINFDYVRYLLKRYGKDKTNNPTTFRS